MRELDPEIRASDLTCGLRTFGGTYRDKYGCFEPIVTVAEVYRCTECRTPFHVGCANRHFAGFTSAPTGAPARDEPGIDPESLDAAWKEAEAACAELGGLWHLAGVYREWGRRDGELAGWRATANDGKYMEQATEAKTPVAALTALATKLRTPF